MSTIIELMQKTIELSNNKEESLKKISGKVVEVVEFGVVIVDVLGKTIKLLNKTGEELFAGDSVIIYYWNNIANGYVAIKQGSSKTGSGSYKKKSAVVFEEEQ